MGLVTPGVSWSDWWEFGPQVGERSRPRVGSGEGGGGRGSPVGATPSVGGGGVSPTVPVASDVDATVVGGWVEGGDELRRGSVLGIWEVLDPLESGGGTVTPPSTGGEGEVLAEATIVGVGRENSSGAANAGKTASLGMSGEAVGAGSSVLKGSDGPGDTPAGGGGGVAPGGTVDGAGGGADWMDEMDLGGEAGAEPGGGSCTPFWGSRSARSGLMEGLISGVSLGGLGLAGLGRRRGGGPGIDRVNPPLGQGGENSAGGTEGGLEPCARI